MNDSQQPPPDADAADDPEILALLDFEPVPRRFRKEGGWNAEMQRLFIARLAQHGSPGKACDELGMYRSGIDKVYKNAEAASFRDAWAAAVALAEKRRAGRVIADHAGTADLAMPFVDNRRKLPAASAAGPLDSNGNPQQPGQLLNEYGEWEDEDSYLQRAEEAKDSIAMKLLRIRRAYLQEISGSAGKRAAFEILTELPVDWELAAKMQPQPFEPWTRTNQRQPDMILTAESGWSFGEIGYGPDRKAEARREIDAYRAERGMDPIRWESEPPSP